MNEKIKPIIRLKPPIPQTLIASATPIIAKIKPLIIRRIIPNEPTSLSVTESVTQETLKPYWTQVSKNISNSLWLPSKTNLKANEVLYLNGPFKQFDAWHSPVQIPLTSPLLSLTSATSIDDNMSVTRKVRIYPNEAQKTLFRKCFGIHRYFYNKAVAEINRRYQARKDEWTQCLTCIFCSEPKHEDKWTCSKHKKKKLNWKLNINLIDMRNTILVNDNDLSEADIWQREVPFDTRQFAIKDAISAYKACTTNLIRGNIAHFKMQYMSRKNHSKIFWVNKKAFSIREGKVHMFTSRLKEHSRLRIIKNIPEQITSDSKIFYDRGSYYLVLTMEQQRDAITHKFSSIALDPGVRSFQTGYSPDGITCKFGDTKALGMLHKKIDAFRSKRSKAKNRTKVQLKKRLARLELYLYGTIENLHNQTASILCKNFNVIFLPTFGTSKMQVGETLGSTTKRRMGSFAHYRFQKKLIDVSRRYNAKVYLVNESYTTQTCGDCGTCKDVNGLKQYTCGCGYTMDRDIHGARNIWIKTMTEHGLMMNSPGLTPHNQ